MGKSILVLAPTEREYRHMLATIAAKSNLKNSFYSELHRPGGFFLLQRSSCFYRKRNRLWCDSAPKEGCGTRLHRIGYEREWYIHLVAS